MSASSSLSIPIPDGLSEHNIGWYKSNIGTYRDSSREIATIETDIIEIDERIRIHSSFIPLQHANTNVTMHKNELLHTFLDHLEGARVLFMRLLVLYQEIARLAQKDNEIMDRGAEFLKLDEITGDYSDDLREFSRKRDKALNEIEELTDSIDIRDKSYASVQNRISDLRDIANEETDARKDSKDRFIKLMVKRDISAAPILQSEGLIDANALTDSIIQRRRRINEIFTQTDELVREFDIKRTLIHNEQAIVTNFLAVNGPFHEPTSISSIGTMKCLRCGIEKE